MFKKRGFFTVKTDAIDEDSLMEVALSNGADDMKKADEVYEIICAPDVYDDLKAAMEQKQIPLDSAELSMMPENTVAVTDAEIAQRILALIEEFEDHDDVQEVYANFDIPDDILDKIQ